MEGTRKNSFTGTAEYVAPEVLKDCPAGPEADLWAFGCIVYQMLAGEPPFRGGSDYLTFQLILKQEFSFPAEMGEDARDLIRQILVADPATRLGAAQRGGYDAIRSQRFFADIDWQAVSSEPAPPFTAAPHAAAILEARKPAFPTMAERSQLLQQQAKSPWCVRPLLVAAPNSRSGQNSFFPTN